MALGAFGVLVLLVPLLTIESFVVRPVALTFIVLTLGAILNMMQYLICLLGTRTINGE